MGIKSNLIKTLFLLCTLICTFTLSAEEIVSSNCSIKNILKPVNCIDYSVPLNWQVPDKEKIDLFAVQVKALSKRNKVAIIVLAGGPGQAASDYGGIISTTFKEANEFYDIILFDQRGAGRSNGVKCEEISEFPLLAIPSQDQTEEVIRRCAEQAPIDVRYLTSDQVIQDLDYLRKQLGYEKLILWGGSYGTRLVQYYVRDYEQYVERVILDAALPVATSLFDSSPASAEASMQLLFAACKDNEHCQRVYPNLDETLSGILDEYEQTSKKVSYLNALTGQRESAEIDRNSIANILRTTLYRSDRLNIIPFIIDQISRGNFDTLAALAIDGASWSSDTMYVGVTLSVLCSEEIPSSSQKRNNFGFTQDYYFKYWAESCQEWPHRDLAEFQSKTFMSDVPALIISGQFDPVTPPRLGDLTKELFTNSVHIVIPNASHTNSTQPCIKQMIKQFIVDKDMQFNTECLADFQLDPFVLNINGPESMEVK